MILPSLLAAFFGNDIHIAPSCDLRGHMALSVRYFSPAQPRARQDAPFSQAAMAIRMFEVPFRPWSRMEQVAEPSNDRAMRFTSLEQSSDMGVILFILVELLAWRFPLLFLFFESLEGPISILTDEISHLTVQFL